MFTRRSETESMLDAEIRVLLDKMDKLDKTTPEYDKHLERVSKLHKLKAEEQPKRVTPDTALLVAANMFGILAIIHHEQVGPLTSKAMAFIIKPR